jgi:uncharacterized protein YgbK (DUF1537 family)
VSGVVAGIQADDLTGACDTGAAFAARGLETLVLLPGAPGPATPPEVLVLDTESRRMAPAEARAATRAAAGRLTAAGARLVYKKVDSTLRGPVAAEIRGVLEGSGRGAVLLAPAFPAQARTVVDGLVRVGGRLASETAIADDPTFPATGASVVALLGLEGPHPVGPLPLATLRAGADVVAARLDRWLEAAAGSLVADAETDADLAVLADEVTARPVLLAGSAGLAAALARRLPQGSAAPGPGLAGPLLAVAGSAHPATHAQVERLRGHPTARLLAPPRDPAADRDAVLAGLAEAARAALAAGGVGTLLLTGGETALAVCRAIGATGIRLLGEVEPGLAWGALAGGAWAGLPVVTKAGGFGDPETLVRVAERCR